MVTPLIQPNFFYPLMTLLTGFHCNEVLVFKYVTVKQYIYCLAPQPEKFHFPSWRVYWIDPPPSSPLKIVLCINVGLTYTSHLPLQFPSNFLWGGVDNIFAFGVHSKSKASEDKIKSIVGLGLSQ